MRPLIVTKLMQCASPQQSVNLVSSFLGVSYFTIYLFHMQQEVSQKHRRMQVQKQTSTLLVHQYKFTGCIPHLLNKYNFLLLILEC
jgi:hypothetical protein